MGKLWISVHISVNVDVIWTTLQLCLQITALNIKWMQNFLLKCNGNVYGILWYNMKNLILWVLKIRASLKKHLSEGLQLMFLLPKPSKATKWFKQNYNQASPLHLRFCISSLKHWRFIHTGTKQSHSHTMSRAVTSFLHCVHVCLSKAWPYLTSISSFSDFSLDQITVHQKLQV